MPTFITFVNWTDQGIKNIKQAPARAEAAKELLRSLGGEPKEMFVLTGRYDMALISEAPDGDILARFALAVSAQGNVRTETVRAFSMDEFAAIVADLP
jgi:uncharacterized protein with GYD domain